MKTLIIGLSIMVTSASAAALDLPPNCPQRPQDEDSAVALASTWFEKGDKHVKNKEYSEAVEAFSCSLRMVPHRATMFNAARAALLAEQYEVSLELCEMILSEADDEETRQEARDLMAEVKAAMPEPEPEPEPEPGPEPEPARQEEPALDEGRFEPADEGGHSGLWTTGIVSLVTGSAGLVLGGVFQGLAGSAQKTTGETDDYSEYLAARDDIGKFQTGATISFIAGGVLFGAGIAMSLIDKRREDPVEVSIAPTPNGVVLGGTF